MPQRDDATCSTCAFWWMIKNSERGAGECRRRAPAAITLPPLSAMRIPVEDEEEDVHYVVQQGEEAGNDSIERVFPETVNVDWCGEWTERGSPADPRRALRVPCVVPQDLATASCETLEVTRRVVWALARRNITTLGELVELTWRDLMVLGGIGIKAVREIEGALKKMGLTLAAEPEPRSPGQTS